MSPGFYFQFVACLENVINNARPYNSNIESRHLPSSPSPTQPSRNPPPFSSLLGLLDLHFPLSFLWMSLAVKWPEQQPGDVQTRLARTKPASSSKNLCGKLTLVTLTAWPASSISYHSHCCPVEKRIAFPWEESLQLVRCEVTFSQRIAEGCCWEGEFFTTALGRLIQKK